VTGRPVLGKRTARLLRDAIVLAHVEGVWWGRAVPRGSQEDQYPKDVEVIAKVLEAARRNKDHYGALGRLAERLDAEARAKREDS
jgi:hypothetical protein